MKIKSGIYSLVVMFMLLMFASSCSKDNTQSLTVTDIDGNIYKTVTIGTQVWMVENLKVTKYRNGDPILNISDDAAWNVLTTGAYCWYKNDVTNKAPYGALYNWYAVDDSRKITPIGWHVPSLEEWTTLITFLGGEIVNGAGGKLRETGNKHWLIPNIGDTNSSGFTALPGGTRYQNSPFYDIGLNGYWWTATSCSTESAWILGMYYLDSRMMTYRRYMLDGLSIRCIKD